MADTVTSNYSWVKPEITGSPSTWGNKWNSNLDLIDTAIFNANTAIAARLPLAGGTLTGVVHSSVGDGGGNQLVTHDQAAAVAQYVITQYLPVGIIMIWAGSVAAVPAFWHLCDGTIGTPDLRDRFVVGAGASYAVGATGGATSNTPGITVAGHTLTTAEIPVHNHGINDPGHGHGINDPGHSHTIKESLGANASTPLSQIPNGAGSPVANTDSSPTGISIAGSATGITIQNAGLGGAHSHAASSSAVPTLPPYYALAYVMRI